MDVPSRMYRSPNKPSLLVMEFELPPSVNHCYRPWTYRDKSTGQTVKARRLTSEAETWISGATLGAKTATGEHRWELVSRPGKVCVWLSAFWPDNRKRDVSNLEKLMLDALEGSVYEDDRQAVPRWLDFAVAKFRPRLWLAVSEFTYLDLNKHLWGS